MNSRPIRESSQTPPGEGPEGLTAAQQNFAEIVGRALADVWHRQLQDSAGLPSSATQENTHPAGRSF